MHTVLCVQLRTENDLKEIATVRNLTVMCIESGEDHFFKSFTW